MRSCWVKPHLTIAVASGSMPTNGSRCSSPVMVASGILETSPDMIAAASSAPLLLPAAAACSSTSRAVRRVCSATACVRWAAISLSMSPMGFDCWACVVLVRAIVKEHSGSRATGRL